MASPKTKEPGEAEIVKIPTGAEIANVMKTQINNYTAKIEESLKGKTSEQVPEKVRVVAEALGYWDEEKGITELKKFAGKLNGVLQESMKMMGKENCFSEMCDGARNGQPITKPMYLSFEGAEKFDVSNDVLRDILGGFGKHLDRVKDENKNVAVNFKSVELSEDDQGNVSVEIKLNWIGPVKAIEMDLEAQNEFSGKKKERLNLPEVVPRKTA
jgi:hypothetical protein